MKILEYVTLTHQATVLLSILPQGLNIISCQHQVRNCWNSSPMPEACKRGKEKKVFRTVLATEKYVRVKQE